MSANTLNTDGFDDEYNRKELHYWAAYKEGSELEVPRFDRPKEYRTPSYLGHYVIPFSDLRPPPINLN